ncbi:uncharacterized protein [Nicotiana sylvestris]|uniref:uncharacterized protein n=1 Tax=Nicotiana sylvestris TaxID=4096 RepID=UPI00388C65D8
MEALKEGLTLALNKGLVPIMIETDSTEVIKAINEDYKSHHMTISSCMWLMHQLKDPPIQHNFRDRNQVAHNLAKDALNNPKSHVVLDRPPSFVINKLNADRDGHVYLTKSLPTCTCINLANLGNISVIKSSTYGDDVTNSIP